MQFLDLAGVKRIKQYIDDSIVNFITNSVSNLTNYYLKSETYTKSEVEALIAAINQFHYEIAASTSAVSSPANNVLYLIGPTGTGEDKYEEYVYSSSNWIKIGDTSISLSGYVTTQMLNTALADYTNTTTLNTLLAGKQDVINDLSDIRTGSQNNVKYTSQSLIDTQKTQARTNIGAGTYSKPSSGIPAADLASAVQTSLGKADTALQSFTETDPTVPAHVKAITSSDISNWNSKTNNTGTVTQVKVGTTPYNPSNGVVSLPAYPTTLPASDVSAWAKASTKPTYTASEVGAATESYVDTAVSGIVNSAPTTLDTLNELATALGNDPNFATTVATQIGQKYTKPSTGIPASDLANDVIPYVENFYFVQGSSSQAGNATSGSYLSTKWEGTVPGVSTAVNGLKIAYRVATNTGVSTAGVVLSIDGTNYYPVVIQKNTIVTTHYPVGTTVLMVFNSTQTATAYLTSNTKSTVTGCWQIMEYDSNTNTYQRVYTSSNNVEYPITTRYNITSGSEYYAEYGRYSEGVTLNPSTNTITAGSFKIANGTSSQFLKADGSVDSNTYALASSVPAAQVQSDWNATTGMGVILNKPTIPAAVTESTVSGWGFTKNTGTYSKPSGGIPKTDLASAVQTSLGKADTALQSFTETDPVFSVSAAAGITASDITNWNGKTSNTGTVTGVKINGTTKNPTSGVVDLGTVLTSYTETDPTVPSWAKAASKPTYTASEVGALPDTTVIPTVPTISTNVVSDKTSDVKTSSPKSVYSEIHPTVVTTQPSGGFVPNIFYRLGTITGSATFSLVTPTDNTIENEYHWSFTAGNPAPTITWPSGIEWVGGESPTINAGQKYEISILDNIAGNILEPVSSGGGSSYTLPIASESGLGGIKVGSGLSIDSTTGVLSVTGGGSDISDVTLGGTSVVSNGVAVLPSYPTTLPASDVSAWAKAANKPTYTASEVGALSSSTVIPSKTSDLTNDSGFRNITISSSEPTSSQGNNGDIWIVI